MSRTGREAEKRILRFLQDHAARTHLPQIHAHIIRHSLHQSNILLSQFVSVCGALHRMPYAHSVFLHTQNPNILLFNSMIKGYSLSGPSQQPLQLFTLMRLRGISPDHFTFAPLLKSCTLISDLKFGRRLHAEVLAVGFDSYNGVQIGIVELYTGCGEMEDAMRMFDQMPHRDVVVWNLVIRGFCKRGNVGMGFRLFRGMSERSIVSWNTMILGLAQSGRKAEALELFHEMRREGCYEPDDATLVTVLPVCAYLGDVELGKWIHSYADSKGLLRKFAQVGNSVVDFYYKCGDLENARRVFDKMTKKSVVSWNTMISGLAYNGHGKLGLKVFEEMRGQCVEPNSATFVGVLSCCTHAGLVQRGRELFDLMTTEHNIKPRLEHYGCMVDLLGRGGCMKEAQELISRMPMKPNAAIWGALLSACRIHGDLELAESAVKELIHLEPENSGNYVLLSNIYAELGKWDDVEKARALMKEKHIQKVPGESVLG